LRVYITEVALSPRSVPQDALRAQLFQTVAIIQLLLQRWCEPLSDGGIHLSTLVQQVLSTIAQHGGATAAQLWQALCGSGPFAYIDQETFGRLLRCLGQREIMTQSSDGTLLLGLPGERLLNHYDFYAAFTTTEEFRLFSGGRELGTLPIDHPVAENMYLIFAGRRWRIVGVDSERRTIDLEPAAGGVPPLFHASGGGIHDRVRQEMLRLYSSTDVPVYLDSNARTLFDEGRHHFRRLGLDEHRLIPHGRDTLLFLWRGDRALNTVLVQLMLRGLRVSKDGIALEIEGAAPNEVSRHLRDLVEVGSSEPAALANAVAAKRAEKCDWVLDEVLLNQAYAARSLDVAGAHEAMREATEVSR
jgi:ATP-dependent Lhr-like helicase